MNKYCNFSMYIVIYIFVSNSERAQKNIYYKSCESKSKVYGRL